MNELQYQRVLRDVLGEPATPAPVSPGRQPASEDRSERVTHLQAVIAVKDETLASSDAIRSSLEQAIASLQQIIALKDQHIAQLEAFVREQRRGLDQVHRDLAAAVTRGMR